MEESSTYQAFLRQGEWRGVAIGEERGQAEKRAEEARRFLVRLGSKRLGTPTESVMALLDAITVPHRFENLADRLSDVESWNDLLEIG